MCHGLLTEPFQDGDRILESRIFFNLASIGDEGIWVQFANNFQILLKVSSLQTLQGTPLRSIGHKSSYLILDICRANKQAFVKQQKAWEAM